MNAFQYKIKKEEEPDFLPCIIGTEEYVTKAYCGLEKLFQCQQDVVEERKDNAVIQENAYTVPEEAYDQISQHQKEIERPSVPVLNDIPSIQVTYSRRSSERSTGIANLEEEQEIHKLNFKEMIEARLKEKQKSMTFATDEAPTDDAQDFSILEKSKSHAASIENNAQNVDVVSTNEDELFGSDERTSFHHKPKRQSYALSFNDIFGAEEEKKSAQNNAADPLPVLSNKTPVQSTQGVNIPHKGISQTRLANLLAESPSVGLFEDSDLVKLKEKSNVSQTSEKNVPLSKEGNTYDNLKSDNLNNILTESPSLGLFEGNAKPEKESIVSKSNMNNEEETSSAIAKKDPVEDTVHDITSSSSKDLTQRNPFDLAQVMHKSSSSNSFSSDFSDSMDDTEVIKSKQNLKQNLEQMLSNKSAPSNVMAFPQQNHAAEEDVFSIDAVERDTQKNTQEPSSSISKKEESKSTVVVAEEMSKTEETPTDGIFGKNNDSLFGNPSQELNTSQSTQNETLFGDDYNTNSQSSSIFKKDISSSLFEDSTTADDNMFKSSLFDFEKGGETSSLFDTLTKDEENISKGLFD